MIAEPTSDSPAGGTLRLAALAALTALTGVMVALVYYAFEAAIGFATQGLWNHLLHTDEIRLLVIPTALVLGFVFFGAMHWLEPEAKPQHGLGEDPDPTIKALLVTLFIGFLSLLAGASLGPEAILVPASLIIGGWLATTTMPSDSATSKLLAGAALVALFAAFFHSILIGIAALLILLKQGAKLSVGLVVAATIASWSSYLTLVAISGGPLARLPHQDWSLNASDLAMLLVFVAAGWLLLKLLAILEQGYDEIEKNLSHFGWQLNALIASTGIGLLYFTGGTLVQFTGNTSFVPLFTFAPQIGLIGLGWVLIVKIAAIAWSRSLNYRGGVIFPSLLACGVVVAIAGLYLPDLNTTMGIFAVFAGMLLADRKTDVLF